MDLGPGAADGLDPEDLDDIRARVVVPVVTSLLSAHELVSVDVVRRRATAPLTPPDLPHGTGVYFSVLDITHAPDHTEGRDDDRPGAATSDEVWVVLEALGDEHAEWVVHSAYVPQPWTLGDAAAQLADQMSDWICETRFGWGDLREPQVTIPARG